jgi:hypothetical protein
MTGEALIISANGSTRHVYLHQMIDSYGGRWATIHRANANSGFSLHGDGSVFQERYHAQTNERLSTKRVQGATWRPLERA